MVEHIMKEYESPAYMKLRGAARHFQSLDRAVLTWRQQNPILAPTRLQVGRDNSYELFMPDQPRVPLLEWSSLFGDAVHNLRAALDLLTFELCHLEGVGPERPNQVSFPVLNDQKLWARQTRHLASIPASLLKRIADVQPWQTEPDLHVLTLITALDNMDKHRTTVGLLNFPGALEPPRLYPIPADATDEIWQDPWINFSLDDGGPLSKAHWPALWRVEPNPMVYFEGRMTFMVPFQRWLYQETDRIFHYLISGSWPEGGTLPQPEWVQVPQLPPG